MMEVNEGRWREATRLLLAAGVAPFYLMTNADEPRGSYPQLVLVKAMCRYYQGQVDEAEKLFYKCAVQPNNKEKCLWFAKKCEQIQERLGLCYVSCWCVATWVCAVEYRKLPQFSRRISLLIFCFEVVLHIGLNA